MLLGRYLKWITAFFTTLLVSEQIPLINMIDAPPSEPSQLFSAVSEFASEVKDNIVEMMSRPSHFFHENNHNQSQPALALPPPPVDPSPESPSESLQPPEVMPSADPTSRFWRMEGSKLILELDLGWVPKFEPLRKAIGWVACLFGLLFLSASRVDSAGQSYWVYAAVPAAIGFFGGLGYGFGGWCRWCLSRMKPPKAVEKVGPVKEVERRAPSDAYLESRLSQSYMMPLDFQRVLHTRGLRVSAPTVAPKPENAEETMGRIAKKEEDENPLAVPTPLPSSFWYSPSSPISPTPLSDNGLDLPSYDGFQPKPKVSRPNDLPDTLMGSFPFVPSPLVPPESSPLKISDPWINDTPNDRAQIS